MRSIRVALVSLGVVCKATTPALSQEQAWSLDVDGELRERFESVNNPVFGLSTPVQNDYFLHRAMLAGRIRHDSGFGVGVKVVSGLVSGWDHPPPTQDDPFDVLEGYVEHSMPFANGELALRVGRQEMVFGAARLVSVRESPNIRRAFDGANATRTRRDARATAFFVRPVSPQDGVLDDRSSNDQRFWGVYVTWPAAIREGLGVDAYYLGLDRADARFAQGVARELRHTVGTRLFGEAKRWDWNVEAAWQWGSFGSSDIRAWTVSVDAGFAFTTLPHAPRLGLKADAISGDEDPEDRRLGTFNPLFPKLPYFSEANLATPANLLDVQPNLRLSLTDRISATLSWNKLWKHKAADAFYTPPLVPVAGTSRTSSRDVGWQASVLIAWQATDRLELAATYVGFEPGPGIRQAQGRDGSFFAAWIRWTY